MTQFVVVPQWQGSSSSRAMLLADGAHAIAGDLPRAACTTVEVPLEAGESLDTGVHRASALLRVAATVADELSRRTDRVVVVGGDRAVAVPAIGAAAAQHPSLAVVWCSAHAALLDPTSSATGSFDGMALRAVLGDAMPGLAVDEGALDRDRLVLVGVRDIDPAEEDGVAGLARVHADELTDPDRLAQAVQATGADAVYVMIDLDVIDPAEITGVTDAVPFGVSAAQLAASIARLREHVPLAGAAITGFAPSTPAAAVDDLGTILRLVGAVA